MGAGGQWNDRGAPEGGQGHTTWPQGGDSHNRYTERNKVCDIVGGPELMKILCGFSFDLELYML